MTVRPDATATDRFMGKCGACGAPASRIIADAAGDKATGACPACSARLTLKRLYAVKTLSTCHAKCMSAAGPACSCSCGGENHGGRWSFITSYTTGEAMDAAAEHAAKAEAKRAAAAERKAGRARAAFQAWTAAGNADVVEYLAGVDRHECSQFLFDMATTARELKPLSPRQADAVRRCAAWDAERKAKAEARAAEASARRAAGVTAPSGKRTVTGTVVSVKFEDSSFGAGGVYKMLVKLDDGARIYSTVPSKIRDVNRTTQGNLCGLRDARISLTATFQPSRQDATFGYASRPSAVLI